MSQQLDDPMADQLDNLAILGDDTDVEEEEEVKLSQQTEENQSFEPEIGDVRWTEYVMKHFEPDELFDGYPVVDGLRRVATKLLGPILSSKPRTVQAPSSANGFHATVEWEVVIRWERDDESGAEPRIFGDVADVSPNNTESPFCLHAAAVAATKAEGRALRKALHLSRVHSAEEMMDTPEDTGDSGRKITDSQLTFINMKAVDLDINTEKMFRMTMEKNGYKSVRDVPYQKAVSIFHWINQVQCGTKTLPEDLKGYDPDWKKKLGV